MQVQARWRWLLLVIPVACMAFFLADWRYEVARHSTPEKAQHLFAPTVGPFAKVHFGSRVVLFMPSAEDSGTVEAFLLEDTFWGWRVVSAGWDSGGMNSFTRDGSTFIWGTVDQSLRDVLYHRGHTTYHAHIAGRVWYMEVPFTEHVFYYKDWQVVLLDGSKIPWARWTTT
ncbi:hypothetical protein GCM10010885_08600 [Alicyclobacillus cellulosilyticus]|uniref:Uncharacterized protein n=1 Tax=Alicyclobacillus cellulosilyticus TaxID=1003997 RepID=A0A917NHT5_9BACL|nr:hypothetical protein [Alicyclobacillus cellulosilyticus]GGJ01675.1 hypothetical protein GCM10010885_08600 [Alicyclobacillus cellulosilyticus]